MTYHSCGRAAQQWRSRRVLPIQACSNVESPEKDSETQLTWLSFIFTAAALSCFNTAMSALRLYAGGTMGYSEQQLLVAARFFVTYRGIGAQQVTYCRHISNNTSLADASAELKVCTIIACSHNRVLQIGFHAMSCSPILHTLADMAHTFTQFTAASCMFMLRVYPLL